ncbi:hypothetical protein L596_025673 [Steinernema carpocapsae]|uniref:Uncharacterized protein n=1 Tax=Steinernema carpocapsae TaxID=34508 RepID=A0A4U5M8N9_STECR|nr:hypothetical protein L596_025673 [Steinernema carpocapsae]
MCSRPLVEDEVNQKAIEESTEKLTLLKSSKRPAADAEEEIGKKKSRFPKKLSAFGDLSIGSKMAKVAARIVTVSCYRTAGRKPVTKVLLQDRDGDCCTLLGWEDEADRLHKALDGKETRKWLLRTLRSDALKFNMLGAPRIESNSRLHHCPKST